MTGSYPIGWHTCSVCGLTASEVEGMPLRCKDPLRCGKVIRGESFGHAMDRQRKFNPDDLPEPPPPNYPVKPPKREELEERMLEADGAP